MSVRGFQMALMCQKVVSQPQNTLRNGALAAKLEVFTLCDFAAISQLRNEFTGLPNGTRVPKSGFAVAKLPAEWGFGCENWEFLRFGISQPFCSCEMRVTVLRNGTRVPKVGFAAAKYPAKWSFGFEIGNFHALELRSRFVEAAKSRRPLFFPYFCPVFALFLLQTIFLQFLCNSSWIWSSKNLYYIKTN